MTSVIVVDDEPGVRRMLCDFLEGQGCRVREAADGAVLRRLLQEQTAQEPPVVLLDVTMPRENGLDLLAYLRRHHEVGVIMLTAADSLADRVVGLEGGADDYVTKPFDPHELKARIEAVHRRRAALAAAGSPAVLPFGPYRVDLKRFLVLTLSGQPVELLPTEVDLVAAFASHPGRVLSREELLRLAPARSDDTLDRSIDSRVTRLRRKLDPDPARPTLIQTVRGGGYVHRPPIV